jgi:hypothetical protein
LILNSFIISGTSFRQISWWDQLKTEADFAAAHVLLQKDEPETYIKKLFSLMLASPGKRWVKSMLQPGVTDQSLAGAITA